MEVILSREAEKFLRTRGISDRIVSEVIEKFERFLAGERINLDAKKMKGKWTGFFRVRVGAVRIILEPRIDRNEIFIERIRFRGGAYQ